ncbi:MAG: NUDIX hydrolase [Candidatus Gracilibacteria bacterium]
MNNIENGWYRISVKALIYNKSGEFLLCKEDNGVWDIPGGGLDHGEDPINCITRELKEEMGLEVVFINKTPKYFVTANKPESKTRPWIANICYEVKVKDLNYNTSKECVEIGFFSPEKVNTINAIVNVIELSKIMLENK